MNAVNRSSGGLTVTLGFVQDQAVLGVHGKVDHHTVSEFAALLDAVIVSGYHSVVLDLTAIDLMDPAGLRVITQAATRVVTSGGELTMRSSSTMAERTIDAAWLSRLVRQELRLPIADRLGPQQLGGPPEMPVRNEPTFPRSNSERIVASSTDRGVVDGALRLVVKLATATVGAADGASVTLRRHGRLTTVAASNQTVSDMDANQYSTGEGPCVDASVEGRWFHAESLDTETRWPAFTPRAHALGINAILSSPLLTKDRPVGALNIYSRTVAAFATKDQELAATFATEASAILTDAGMDVTDSQLASRLGTAKRNRHVISLAQGVIMERETIGEDLAYTRLREFSQRTNRPLRERAEDVMTSALQPQPGIDYGLMGSHDGL